MMADRFQPKPPSWRQSILDLFPADSPATLTVVSDRDHLLAETQLVETLAHRGWVLIPFDDPVAGRLVLERDFREPRDLGRPPAERPVVWLTTQPTGAAPYDLLAAAQAAARVIELSAAAIFPDLSAAVLAEIDRADFDLLWDACRRERPGRLGRRATAEFVLRHVWSLDVDALAEPAALLQGLLQLHYSGRRLTPELAGILLVRLQDVHGGWPLERMIDSAPAFFDFLSRRWEPFVRAQVDGARQPSGFGEARGGAGSWDTLPFDDPRIRVSLANLFAEGLMTPTLAVAPRDVAGTWLSVGIDTGVALHDYGRIGALTTRLAAAVPGVDALHRDWLTFAPRFGDWLALRRSLVGAEPVEDRGERDALHAAVDAAFTEWVTRHYDSLASLSPWPRPALLHHLPPYLDQARRAASGAGGVAVVVVDGMGWADWCILRGHLGLDPRAYTVTEQSLFAGLPTLTDISRRALFAAMASRLARDAKGDEPALWRAFWEGRGVPRRAVHLRVQGLATTDAAFGDEVLELAGTTAKGGALGIVVNTVDRLLHDAPAGWGPFHAAIDRWAAEGELARLIEGLADLRFRVVVTADHGNTQAIGIGRPDGGVLAERRAERVLFFDDERALAQTRTRNPGLAFLDWPSSALPERHRMLMARGRDAFVPAGTVTLCHGGASLEEAVVPFIEIAARPCPTPPSASTAESPSAGSTPPPA